MLIQETKKDELLKQVKGMAIEIDLPLVIENLTWAINSLVDLGRQAKDLDDKTNYFTQIEAITDCLRWAGKIKYVANEIDVAEEVGASVSKAGGCHGHD